MRCHPLGAFVKTLTEFPHTSMANIPIPVHLHAMGSLPPTLALDFQ
jgi:hypothetical protein